MQRMEVSCAVRLIYIYVGRRQRVTIHFASQCNNQEQVTLVLLKAPVYHQGRICATSHM